MKKRRAAIRDHFESEFLKWAEGTERYWERRGLRGMDREYRQGWYDLWMVGRKRKWLEDLWREQEYPRYRGWRPHWPLSKKNHPRHYFGLDAMECLVRGFGLEEWLEEFPDL